MEAFLCSFLVRPACMAWLPGWGRRKGSPSWVAEIWSVLSLALLSAGWARLILLHCRLGRARLVLLRCRLGLARLVLLRSRLGWTRPAGSATLQAGPGQASQFCYAAGWAGPCSSCKLLSHPTQGLFQCYKTPELAETKGGSAVCAGGSHVAGDESSQGQNTAMQLERPSPY